MLKSGNMGKENGVNFIMENETISRIDSNGVIII